MKRMLSVLLCAIWMVTVFLSGSAAAEEKEMVYAPRAKQEQLFALTQREGFDRTYRGDGYRIVLESITPVYTIDVWEYEKTGVIRIKPDVYYVEGREVEGVYVAKLVNEEGAFAGNLTFYVQDGIAYPGYQSSTLLKFPQNSYYEASDSYADHAARIRDCLGRSEFVPATSVKYVTCVGVGTYFYVQNGDTEAWIPIGRVWKEDLSSPGSGEVKLDPVFSQDQMKNEIQNYLDRVNAHRKEVEAWEREHPGEKYNVTGGRIETPASICSRMDNILNIDEYLGIPVEGNPSPVDALAHQTPWLWLGLACGCVVLAAGGAVGVGIRKKRNRRGGAL